MPQPEYEIIAGRVCTRALEVHIVDHCNLRCQACCSLSPHLPKWFIDPSDLDRDLQLARGAIAPGILKLVGGEPSLHPALDECLEVARRAAIAPVVSVTTNGFLLPRASPRFWQLAQALTISLYPQPQLPGETIALVERRAAEHRIPINWKRQDHFVQMDEIETRTNATATREIFDDCWLRRRCHIVSHGAFYTCTRPPHFETFYGPGSGYRDDGLILDAMPGMAERVRNYLGRSEPLKACSICRGGNAPTAPHRQMTAAEIHATINSKVA